MFEGPLEDRVLIRELYGVYSDATMRQDRGAYLALWAEDGVRVDRDDQIAGREAIGAHWDKSWANIQQMAFFSEIGSIVVEGADAAARLHCREIIQLKDGGIWKVVGRYDDLLTKAGGRWLLKRKAYQLVFSERG